MSRFLFSLCIFFSLFCFTSCGGKEDILPDPGPDEPAVLEDEQHVFLCFGQSNMEGQAGPEQVDLTGIDERFQMLAAVDFVTMGREKGKWYKAVPPLCRDYSGLCPVDWFGRTLVGKMPENHKVGVVNVAVAGASIDAFINERVDAYLAGSEQWLKNVMACYGNRPYDRLVEMAKIAQKSGKIAGILVHQGESNTGDPSWPSKLALVYNRLLSDLGLEAKDVPLLVGEVVSADMGGACSYMNTIIDKIQSTIPTAWPIKANGCTCASDNVHFNAAGYRELGRRYAEKMQELKDFAAPR